METPQFHSEKKKPLKTDMMEYFSAYDFSLTEKEIEKARKDLQETEERKIRKLKELRDKLESMLSFASSLAQSDIQEGDEDGNYRIDTPYLLRFLRVRKYDSNRAYKHIKESYLFRRNNPRMSEIPENLEHLLNISPLSFLPYADENGNIMFYLDIGKWKCDELYFEDIFCVSSVVTDFIVMNPRLQVNGTVGVWDMKGLTAEHIATAFGSLGPRALCFCVQSMYPWRVKKIVAFNAGRLSRLLFRMVRPFLTKKFSERFILLGSDMKELHQHINPALLPKKLGGFLEEDQCSITKNIMDNISPLKYERSFS